MQDRQTGMSVELVGQIVCVIGLAWGISYGMLWLIGLVTN